MISGSERKQTSSVQVFRLIEASLIVLFFLEAARAAFAVLLYLVNRAMEAGQVDAAVVNGHLFLIGALVVAWFSPRSRGALPETLSISAILASIARVIVSIDQPAIRLYAGLATLALGGIYLASLLRANVHSWLAAIMIGFVLDQALRAIGNTYDPTLRSIWIAPQVILSAGLIVISRAARNRARYEPYEPSSLTLWDGLAFGGLLALEMLILGLPNVIARRNGVTYASIVPWLMLASTLPLLPGTRAIVARALSIFDERLRGGVWMAALLLLVVIGDRLGTTGGASAFVIAQFMVLLSLWWIPRPSDPLEMEQVGPSLVVGLLAFTTLVYAYSLSHVYAFGIELIAGPRLPIMLVAAGLIAIPRLFLREENPWLIHLNTPKGISTIFIAPMLVIGLIFGGWQSEPNPLPPGPTLRMATYNINDGFDGRGAFRPIMLARTIETSRADVIVLQEVETGQPLGYGMDQVIYLARRLGMWAFFQPMPEEDRGIAVLSRWPIMNGHSQWLPGERQMAVMVTLADASSGREVTILGTQLAPGGEEMRLGQALALISFVGDASPVLLGADLAGGPEDVVYQQLTPGQFIDPEIVLGIEQGYTVPAAQPQARHDYVLVRGLTPLASQQVNSASSDHRLVVVEVSWP